MKPSVNIKIHEGSLSTLWVDEDGILCSVTKNVPRTVEKMKENFALVRTIMNNKKACLLAEATKLPPLDKEARDYMASELPHHFKAMAIISASPLGKMISNIFFTLKPPPFPMKMFTDEQKAKEWLRHYL